MSKIKNNKTAGTMNRTEKIRVFFASYGTFILAALLFFLFGILADHFFEAENIMNILKQISVVAVISIGMTIVIIMGGIDLSVGSVVLFSSVICCGLLVDNKVPVWAAILLGILASGLVGLINGVFIEVIKIAPVIVTLGTMMAVRGLAQILLRYFNKWIWVTDSFIVGITNNKIGVVPVITILVLALYVIAYVVMNRTYFGKSIYAIGGNQKAAYFTGIPVVKTKILAYVLCSMFAGLAGILLSGRMGCINSSIGVGMEFDAITAVVLGGASLAGGSGKIQKTFLGAAIVGLILNYLTLGNVSANYQSAVTGFVILIAALIDRATHGKSE